MTLPKEVWLLTSEDMYKGTYYYYGGSRHHERPNKKFYDDGKCKACLLGHLYMHASDGPFSLMREALNKEVGNHFIPDYNDAPERRLSTLAANWNRAMKRLGYDVPDEYLDPANL